MIINIIFLSFILLLSSSSSSSSSSTAPSRPRCAHRTGVVRSTCSLSCRLSMVFYAHALFHIGSPTSLSLWCAGQRCPAYPLSGLQLHSRSLSSLLQSARWYPLACHAMARWRLICLFIFLWRLRYRTRSPIATTMASPTRTHPQMAVGPWMLIRV